MATGSSITTDPELKTCEIDSCQRISAVLCHHCEKNVCRRHFTEHAEQLVQELNPLVDNLNELGEIINYFGVNDYKQRALDQLTQWRDEAVRTINDLYESKRQKLELLLQTDEEVFSQRKIDHLKVLNALKDDTTFLVKDGDVTFEQLKILKRKLRRLTENVIQTQSKLVYCDLKPLSVADESILFHCVTNGYMRGSTLLCPDYQMKINDFYGDPNQRWELIYKATKDGFRAEDFHKYSDQKGPTMTVIQSQGDGYLFGGYTSISWSGDNKYIKDPKAFLFTLENPFGIQPTKFHLSSHAANAVGHSASIGASFGGVVKDNEDSIDIEISTDANENQDSSSAFPSSYIDTTGKGAVLFTGTTHFVVNEIEVYRRLDESMGQKSA